MPRRKKGSVANGHEGGKSGSTPSSKGKPQQRNAANARERARMRVLSKAFCRLKTKLPMVPVDTKLSKLDTLRLASQYIQFLSTAVTNDQNQESPLHPEMLVTWPFGLNRSTTLVGGNGSSSLGDGGSEAEESSSGCWEPEESLAKDCVHLDNVIPMQIQEPNYKCHSINSANLSYNNNNLPYNFYHNHNQHHRPLQHAGDMRYYQNDIITMS